MQHDGYARHGSSLIACRNDDGCDYDDDRGPEDHDDSGHHDDDGPRR